MRYRGHPSFEQCVQTLYARVMGVARSKGSERMWLDQALDVWAEIKADTGVQQLARLEVRGSLVEPATPASAASAASAASFQPP